MIASYLPNSDADLVSWMKNFSEKMMIFGPVLDFTPQELARINTDASTMNNVVTVKEQLRNAFSSYCALARSLRSTDDQRPIELLPAIPVALPLPQDAYSGIIARVQANVSRIKKHRNYNATIGQELRIVSKPKAFDRENAQPALKIVIENGWPKISWTRGKADGIFLYRKIGTESDYALIDKMVRTSYTDKSLFTRDEEVVQVSYKAKYMKDDEEAGLFSEIATIRVMRPA